jgi:3-methylfumaryl-CoA hydratase
MNHAAEMIASSMPELNTWIGRREVVEDEISLTSVRRIAAMLDLEPGRFVAGSPLPPHWFSLFFHNNARQRAIGPDGHANKGVFLPPIPLPRRMGAGRRAKIMGTLVACEPARRIAEVVGITPKFGRTGALVVLTMRHTIEDKHRTLAVENVDAIYREASRRAEGMCCQSPSPRRAMPPGRRPLNSAIHWSSVIRRSLGTPIASITTPTMRAARKAIPRPCRMAGSRCC